MELKNIYGDVIFALEAAKTVLELVTAARAANANLNGALIDGKPIVTLLVFSGIYPYTVQAVLFQDGSRWVRMGCLWKSLDEWASVGIRKSNLSQFPDDGSERCEERVAAFEFAKAAALRLREKQ